MSNLAYKENPVRNIVRAAKSLVKSRQAFVTEIPQAQIEDDSLQACDGRDWRSYFANKLSGKGLEIGPLHRPMVRHDGMDIDYIDRFTVAELRAHYPELNSLPLVEPHIIGDAETLENIADRKYDFLISAHVIEHMRNPLASLREWCRVLKPGGLLYLVVPDKRVTFDKQRVRTTLEHIIADYQSPSRERDFEHFLDQSIHVNKKTGLAALEHARKWVEEDYSIHFHTFLPVDMLNLLQWFSANLRPLSIVEGPCQAPGSDEFHFLLRTP